MSFKFYTETNFKQTEIGPIPEYWQVVRLGEVAEILMGQSPPGESYNQIGKGSPFLQGKAEFGELYPKVIQYTTMPIKHSKINSILLSVRAPVGDVNIADKEYCIGRGLSSLWFKESFGNNYFLFYYFIYIKKTIEEMGSGSTFKAINKSQIENLPIPLPPLPEQQAIAEVLQTIQEAKEKTEAVIEATRKLKKSMMKHLFTYGNVPLSDVDKAKLKNTEIGPIPEHWQVVRLGEVAEIKSGGTPSKKERAFWENGKIPWIRSEKCQDCFIYDTDEFITEKGLLNSSAKIFEKNTVLIAMVGATIGKTGYLMFPSSTNQNVAGLKPINANVLDYLFLFYSLQNRYYDFAKEGGYKIANLSFIKSFPIPLPPLPEQKAMAGILQAIDEKIEKEEAKKKALENLFKSMLNNLMSGKLRVKKINNKENL